MNIQAVQERAGDFGNILFYSLRCTPAGAFRVRVPSARAGVHRADQHKFGRESQCPAGPGNCYLMIFQRLTQGF